MVVGEVRFILDLDIRSEEARCHWAEFTKLTTFKIRNLLLGTGKMLHMVVFIYLLSCFFKSNYMCGVQEYVDRRVDGEFRMVLVKESPCVRRYISHPYLL